MSWPVSCHELCPSPSVLNWGAPWSEQVLNQLYWMDRDHSCTGQSVRKHLEHNSRSDQRPKQRGHPGIDYTRTQQTESREVEVGCIRRSIDLRGSDRDVTSFEVCGRDGAECHLAIEEALLHGLTAGVPWLVGKYDRETSGQDDERGILMVGWSEVGV